MSLNNIDGYNLSNAEIKKMLDGINIKYHLQLYKVLKNSTLSPNVTKKDLKKIETDIKKLFLRKDIPRLLTESEVEEIVQVIPLTQATFEEISIDNRRQIIDTLRRQISVHKIVVKDGTIDKMKKAILENFYKSQVAAGESVGTNAAVSIGQPMTQDTLNTFHSTGSKNNTTEGVTSIGKLFNLSSSGNGTAVIHFKDKNKTKEEIYSLGRAFRGVNIAMLIKDKKMLHQIDDEDKVWYDNFHTIMGIDNSLEKMEEGERFLRIYLNTFKCYKYDVSIMEVVRAIEKNSKTPGIKQTVKCIASDSYTGIIDIYVSKEFIRRKSEEVSKTISKNQNIFSGIHNTKELTGMFYLKFIKDFSDMGVKGIQNIKGFNVSAPITMTSIFTDIEIDNAKDLEKFSSEPYNLEMHDIDFLWRIRIQKYHIMFTGIDEDKFINLITSAGMKIIENNFYSETPNFVILMPKERDVQFWDKEENKTRMKYEKIENSDRFFDVEAKKISKYFGPKKLIEQKLEFLKEKMFREITDILVNDKKPIFPEIPPLYRYAYYYYAIIDDGDVISDLFNNKLIDPIFTYPDDVQRINELFGIEAARFYLASKYNSLSVLENVNPINIELLIDFQTAYGVLLPVTSNGLAKQGASILTSAAFQDSMTFLERGAAFGTTDHIIGISSSIMSGSMCKNGTGMVNVKYDEEYLKEESNKFKDDESIDQRESDLQLNISDVQGPCYLYVPDQKERPTMRGTGIKERVPSPPRMQKSAIFDDEILDIEAIYEKDISKISENFSLDLDIPDAPEMGSYEFEDLL